MTIYILDTEPQLCAKYLDDKSLDSMIRDIAQVLCNVHAWCEFYKSDGKALKDTNIPLMPKNADNQWSFWSRECKSNYQYLIKLGLCLKDEINFREKKLRNKIIYFTNIILWARHNIPYLPIKCRCKTSSICKSSECEEYRTEFPLVMFKKYFKLYPYKMINIIESYRNYYRAKLMKRIEKEKLYRDESTTGNPSNLYILKLWTKREKPEWLNIG